MERISHKYSDGLGRLTCASNISPKSSFKGSHSGQRCCIAMLHSAPWVGSSRMNDLSEQRKEARQKQVKRERLKGRWECLGAETALDVCMVRHPADVPTVTLTLGEISCKLSSELPHPF